MSNVIETPLSYTERAALIHAKVREIIPLIEGFEFAPKEGLVGLTTGAGAVPIPFLEVNAAVLEGSSELTVVAGGPHVAVGLRTDSAYLVAFRLVSQALHLLARGCRYTLALRRQKAGRQALRVFDYAKALNHHGEKPWLAPHIEAMRRALGTKLRTSVGGAS